MSSEAPSDAIHRFPKVQEAAQSVNDAYLKAYQEELGIESYDAAVSYLVSWYLAGCPLYTVEPVSAK